ncbi:MAG: patatin-like phospholipase family protein [Anaeromyxobacter sp.]
MTAPPPVRRPQLLAALALLLAACAHHPGTPRLERAGGPGYRMSEAHRPGQSDDLLVILAISGGGMRAASLGYGALEELRRTTIVADGQPRRLLDEVDVITAISGGTLPAAYYGLRGEKTFEEFGPRVTSRNLERELVKRILSPSSWFRLPSGTFNRSDLFAEIYDQTVFDGATFGDLQQAGGPFILIHGTDISTGARFSFTQDQFDALCGDVSGVTLGRAVATSTALPPLLSPITLQNRAGTCGWAGPPWLAQVEQAAEGSDTPGRSLLRARGLLAYARPDRPYVHLFDGGLSENLGLSEVVGALDLLEVAPDAPGLEAFRRARRVVVISVNALRFPPNDWDRSAEPPGTGDLEDQMWSIPVDRISLDTVEKVRDGLARWKAHAPGERETYLVNVTFDALKDPAEREAFNQMPTSLALEQDQVDRLRDVSARLMRASPSFQRLLQDLGRR